MVRARVAVLISGRGSNMAALLYAAKAVDCPFEVVLVTGDKPDAAGLALAEAEGVPVAPLSSNELGKTAFFEQLDATIREAGADYVALAGFMRIVPPKFIERWNERILNIHPSLLPKYKGLDTHRQAIENGDKLAGCSVHIVTAKVDDGPVLSQTEVAVLPGDTKETLAVRVLIAEHQLYSRTLAAYVSRPFDATWIGQQVDALASQLPEVGRGTSHGSPGWKVGGEKSGKLFAIIADHHHGEDAVGLLVKASGSDEMNGLIEAQPDIYYWPKYYGANGWLGIKLNRRDVDWDDVNDWLVRSWRSCAPRRLLDVLGDE
ncbi:MAG: phosphoribosylglycinamide formyltransferase [Sphingomicrobium sp.]